MPLLNRGAITNFFGLADEEEYEYQGYPETTKKAVQPLSFVRVSEPTRPST